MTKQDEDLELLSEQAPDREWRIICHYVDEGKLPGRGDNLALYRKGYQFLKRMRKRPGPSEHVRIREEHPAIYKAYALFHDTTSCRWLIEASILADVPPKEVAEYIGSEPEVISMYERLFFNVRDKLNCPGYIQNIIYAPSPANGMDSKDFDLLYKLIAHVGGWDILKEFVEAREMSPKAEKWILKAFVDRMKKLGWTAVHRVEPNQFNAMDIVEKFIELQKLDQGTAPNVENEKVASLLNSLLGSGCLSIMRRRELGADEARAMANVLPYTGILAGNEVKDGTGETEQRN